MLHRSLHSLTPKVWAALEVIQQCLERGEQTLVFAPFHDPLDTLARYLREAGVAFGQMDGRTAPARRGTLSRQFQRGEFPVILGSEACAEGHDWPQARNALLLAYSWSPDKIKQFLDRIWRIVSREDINVYLLVTEGTIDERMADLHEEKCDAMELVLDGELMADDAQELSMADLMDFAAVHYDAEARTVDEEHLAREWPKLRATLQAVAGKWKLRGEEMPKVKCPMPKVEKPVLTILPPPDTRPPSLAPLTSQNIILLPPTMAPAILRSTLSVLPSPRVSSAVQYALRRMKRQRWE